MLTLKDFIGMSTDEQKIEIIFDDTVEYKTVYKGFNPILKDMFTEICTDNEYFRNADKYVVVLFHAVNNVLELIIMDINDYERETNK